MEKKTPLYEAHVALGGKIVPFAGYLLPIQYGTGIIAEHMAVRTKAGLFDVSHMGELVLKGPQALENLQMLLTNDFTGMETGRCRYTLMCDYQGGIIDDLLVYKLAEEEYLLVVNAANRQKDADWIRANLKGEVVFEDRSDDTAQLALQGPSSLEIIEPLVEKGSLPAKYYTFTKDMVIAGVPCLVSKTGYTGEDGFELYCSAQDAVKLWESLLNAGKPYGLIPCGLGARDTLRLEAGMPLYGHEMDEHITPAEAGLGSFVKMEKDNFIGKAAILDRGLPMRKRVGLKISDRGIARENDSIYSSGGELIGVVTSGTHAPYLGRAVAMALVDVKYTALDMEVYVDVRGRKLKAKIVKLPFYSKKA